MQAFLSFPFLSFPFLSFPFISSFLVFPETALLLFSSFFTCFFPWPIFGLLCPYLLFYFLCFSSGKSSFSSLPLPFTVPLFLSIFPFFAFCSSFLCNAFFASIFFDLLLLSIEIFFFAFLRFFYFYYYPGRQSGSVIFGSFVVTVQMRMCVCFVEASCCWWVDYFHTAL